MYLPRDRYNTSVRLRMQEILSEAFDAESVDFTTRVSESVLARLHFVLRPPKGADIPEVDVKALEARLVEATRTWEEDLADALVREVGEVEAGRLVRSWADGFPESYKEDFAARVAVGDLRRIEAAAREDALTANRLETSLYEPVGAGPDERRLKLFRSEPLSLTTVLPFFRNLGVEVVDERPYEIDAHDGSSAYVYDFGLRYPGMSRSSATREMLTDALSAAWSGQTESDGLDQLVIAGGLTWRQIVVLRTYAKYLRQTGSTFSQEYVEQCLLANVAIARRLVALFEARFDPDRGGEPDERRETADALVEEITHDLEGVASLDQDRILRSLLGMIQATVRTSFFQVDDAGRPKAHVAVKLDPKRVPDLPKPLPAHEIWVYSPRVEGVHLRFGAVARGGLRWSDRREDFRTEILGLVKAQMVKNAVIVPTGAKGGFVAKQLPDPGVDREAWLAEGVASYTTFISALLDVTDDLVADPEAEGGRRVEPPPRVVRHDGDDTYLVVAADKGTATFSDIANGDLEAVRLLARRRVRVRRVGRLRPQGDGHHRARRVGVGEAALPRDGPRHPDPAVHRGRRRRHERRRVRQRDAAVGADPAGGGLRPPAPVPRPRPGPGHLVRGAAAAVRPAALVVGRLRHLADQRGRRRAPAVGEVGADHARRCASGSGCPRAPPR